MNLKQITEQLRCRINEQLTEAKEVPNMGQNVIDFDSIGCGIQVETGTTEDGFFSLDLEGYSANSGKTNKFKSELSVGYGLPIEERKQANEEFKAKKEEVKKALLQVANEFDAKIVEVMKSFGFTQEK